MRDTLKFSIGLTFLLLGASAFALRAEPIKLSIESGDRPIQDAKVQPAQFTLPSIKSPFRSFSLSLNPGDEKQTDDEAAPPAPVEKPTPKPNPPIPSSDIPKVELRQHHPQSSPTRSIYQLETGPANPAAAEGTEAYPQVRTPIRLTAEGPEKTAPPKDQALDKPTPRVPLVVAPESKPEPTASEPQEVVERAPATIENLTPWTIRAGLVSQSIVETQWGKPQQRKDVNQHRSILIYDSQEDFKRVEIGVEKGEVISVFLVPEAPITLDTLKQRFRMESTQAVTVQDDQGRIMGQVYPENGLMIPEQASQADQISSFLLQKPTAEAFLIRAKQRSPFELKSRLADIDAALRIEPYSAEAWHEQSLILERLGRHTEAFEASRKSISGIGANSEYQLRRALLAAQLGQTDAAIRSTQMIAEDATNPTHVIAMAYCQLGNLRQQSGIESNRAAVAHHIRAIEIASPLVNHSQKSIRRSAKRTLIDAHLALAIDVAAGDWEKKDATVHDWLQQAKVYVDDMVVNEEETIEWELVWLQRSLMARSYFDKQFDPSEMVDLILGKYRELVTQTDDPFFHRVMEWETGQTLTQAVFIEHSRDRIKEALNIADQAKSLLAAGQTGRQLMISDHLLLGNLYFRVGAILAVRKNDHVVATNWYQLALPHLTHESVQSLMLDRRGETLVSMGVSYWQVGEKPKAIELTEQGKQMIEQAVAAGRAGQEKLLVALQNLSKMHSSVGNAGVSRHYESLAGRIQQSIAR